MAFLQRVRFPVPIRSSLDKDQIKVVIDEVTRWLTLAEEGACMTLPGITGRQAAAPNPPPGLRVSLWSLSHTPSAPSCHSPRRRVVLRVRHSADPVRESKAF